ncbi:MAG: DUF4159 domain-containing protein [Ignavibacteria bacterium]|nr:DUF4159 domain-containing protein [Ignavibacteria bacterium]
MKQSIFLLLFGLIFTTSAISQNEVQIARLKYSGGGDWYNDPSGEVNLLKYVQSVTGIKTKPEYVFVDINSDKIFNYPILFMTGHGNISFTESEAKRLRKYLENGGFLYADDDYGMDQAFRREMKKVFPDQQLQEIPFNHPIYHSFYHFDRGLPKIHEHDKKPPQGFGYFLNGRLVVFYTYESNLGDGWVEPDVYNDPPEIRELAFKMGTNILVYALTH